MVKLSVNVNKVATIRNSRGGQVPSVLDAVYACLRAGVHGITVHPRADARHILNELCRYPSAIDPDNECPYRRVLSRRQKTDISAREHRWVCDGLLRRCASHVADQSSSSNGGREHAR